MITITTLSYSYVYSDILCGATHSAVMTLTKITKRKKHVELVLHFSFLICIKIFSSFFILMRNSQLTHSSALLSRFSQQSADGLYPWESNAMEG